MLRESLKPKHLEVVNESHLHEGHADFENPDDTHFRIIVVSDQFDGQNRINRHRRIHGLLKSCFEKGLHALSIQAFSVKEWAERPGRRL